MKLQSRLSCRRVHKKGFSGKQDELFRIKCVAFLLSQMQIMTIIMTNNKNVIQSFYLSFSRKEYQMCFSLWTQQRITAVLPTWLMSCCIKTFPSQHLNAALFWRKTLSIDDMWWSKLNKTNDPCCRDEKDFFSLPLMKTRMHWMNWMSVPHLQGRGDKYYAPTSPPLRLVTSWKKAIVSPRRLDCKTCGISN